MTGTYENVPSVVRKEDASCFRCNLSRVVTTFQSRRFRAGFVLSRADFYFKTRGDRLCGAVRRRLLFKQSHPGNEPLKNRISQGMEEAKELRFVCRLAVRINLKFLFKKKTREKNR